MLYRVGIDATFEVVPYLWIGYIGIYRSSTNALFLGLSSLRPPICGGSQILYDFLYWLINDAASSI